MERSRNEEIKEIREQRAEIREQRAESRQQRSEIKDHDHIQSSNQRVERSISGVLTFMERRLHYYSIQTTVDQHLYQIVAFIVCYKW